MMASSEGRKENDISQRTTGTTSLRQHHVTRGRSGMPSGIVLRTRKQHALPEVMPCPSTEWFSARAQ
ncbi:hypothetical protein VULLAG_LOCUS11148 [Vulpes lagopus]